MPASVPLKRDAPTDRWPKWWQAQGLDRHSLVADPLFVDPDKGDYRLRDDSPALKLGFKPIPVEKIGPYADPLRASWPIRGGRRRPREAAGEQEMKGTGRLIAVPFPVKSLSS